MLKGVGSVVSSGAYHSPRLRFNALAPQEIDRREAAGEMVAGAGGMGGAFPMRTPEERQRRAVADVAAEAAADAGLEQVCRIQPCRKMRAPI